MNEVQVLFLTHQQWPKLTLRTRLRLFRRNPRRFLWTLLPLLVCWVSRSPLSHVAIAHRDLLIDQGPRGRLYWPVLAYAKARPTLAWLIRVPTPTPVDLMRYKLPTGTMRALPSLIRLLTFGHSSANNCVTTVCQVLIDGGIRVPRSVVTPAQLFDWLRAEGYHLESLD